MGRLDGLDRRELDRWLTTEPDWHGGGSDTPTDDTYTPDDSTVPTGDPYRP